MPLIASSSAIEATTKKMSRKDHGRRFVVEAVRSSAAMFVETDVQPGPFSIDATTHIGAEWFIRGQGSDYAMLITDNERRKPKVPTARSTRAVQTRGSHTKGDHARGQQAAICVLAAMTRLQKLQSALDLPCSLT
jgi:hypothetical protein